MAQATTLDSAPRQAGRFMALQVPNFRLYWLVTGLSMIGDHMETVIRNWLVWQMTHSPFWLGMMVFYHWIPYTLLSPWAGALADRIDNRKFVLFSEGLFMVAAAGMAVFTLTGTISVWHISVLLLLHGIAGGISQPSRQVFVHAMVGKERLLNAVSLSSSMRNTTLVAGPAIGGLCLATIGAGGAFLINTATFIPSLIALSCFIRVTKQVAPAARETGLRPLTQGFSYVRNHPVIAALIGIVASPALLLGNGFMAMMPIFADQILHAGVKGYSVLLTAYGLGAILGALTLAYVGEVRRRLRLIWMAAFAQASLVILFSASPWYPLSVLLLMIIGMAQVSCDTTANTVVQTNSPDAIRGRVMGIYALGTLGTRVVNGLSMGALATLFGAPVAVAISGGMVGLITLVVLSAAPGLRHDA